MFTMSNLQFIGPEYMVKEVTRFSMMHIMPAIRKKYADICYPYNQQQYIGDCSVCDVNLLISMVIRSKGSDVIANHSALTRIIHYKTSEEHVIFILIDQDESFFNDIKASVHALHNSEDIVKHIVE